jgi:hypothetical protein
MTNLGTLSPKEFRASSIPQFSVICVPYQFEGDAYPESKLFVILGHMNNCAVCIKATSQTTRYENSPQLMMGCVYYHAKEVPCFPKNTAIQPDNQIPILHSYIELCYANGGVSISKLPSDFPHRLSKAIEGSYTLNGRERSRLKNLLNLS